MPVQSRSRFNAFLWVAFFTAATIVLTWPLLPRFTTQVPAVFLSTDALLQAFILGWDRSALVTTPLRIFNAPVFHPEPLTLTFMDHLIGDAVFSAPIQLATGSHAAGYNWVLLTSFLFTAWTTYRLARYWGASRRASTLAGFLFTFAPYRFTNLGELNLLQMQFIPLALLLAARMFDKRRPRDVYFLALALAAHVWYSSWYYTHYIVLSVLLLFTMRPARAAIPWMASRIRTFVAAALAFVVVTLPVIVPYLVERRSMASYSRPLEKVSPIWSAHPLDYLRVNEENWLFGHVLGLSGTRGYQPGVVAVILAAAAIAVLVLRRSWPTARERRRRQAAIYLVVLAVFAAIMAAGPVLTHSGGTEIHLPFWYFHRYWPGFSLMRAAGRFALLVTLSASILAALGFDWIVKARAWSSRGAGVFLALCLAAALVTSLQTRLPFQALPQRKDMPEVYRWIAALPDSATILELPMPASESEESPKDALRQFYVLFHHKARLDGVSAFVSADYERYRALMRSFPDSLSLVRTRSMGADYIVYHYGDLDEADRAARQDAMAGVPALGEAARFGDDVVYELKPER